MLNYLKIAGLAIIALIPGLAYWAGKREGKKIAKQAKAERDQAIEQAKFERENERLQDEAVEKAKEEIEKNVDSRQNSDNSFTKSDW